MRGAAFVGIEAAGGVDVCGADGTGACGLAEEEPSLLGILVSGD